MNSSFRKPSRRLSKNSNTVDAGGNNSSSSNESHAGFDDLKKYCHKNNEFIRDVSQLFQERAKLEQLYADGLSKIASKAKKIIGETLGVSIADFERAIVCRTMRQTWEDFGSQAEQESYLHKGLGNDVLEEISKPLRAFSDQQKEARKPAEQAVEKALKSYIERRAKEAQAKKLAFVKSKESENLTVQLEAGRAKALTDKELSKLDAKCKKAEESVAKADDDYICKLVESERARLTLDSAIQTSTQALQKLEEDRIENFKNFLSKFSNLLLNSTPKLNEEEDMNNTMDSTRRKLALDSKVSRLQQYLLAERKARKGLTRLNSVYSDNPRFSTLSGQQDVGFQLSHATSVINLIEASIYRMSKAAASVGNYTANSYRLSSYIEERKDKQGIYHCTLRVPLDSAASQNVDDDDYMPPLDTRATGTYDYSDDDFDDVDPEFEDRVDAAQPAYQAIDPDQYCIADYEYSAQENDELTIQPGDKILILTRHDDGWWKGELNGRAGLFPSSYVHEI